MQDLAHQTLGRPLTPQEQALAAALEKIFLTKVTDFAVVAAELTKAGVVVPSTGDAQWTQDVLARELAAINQSLDEAYAKRGPTF